MSATPQPPARIRVITHPPLDEIKVWLPLPTSQGGLPTIRRLLQDVQKLLSGDSTLSAELQGASCPRSLSTRCQATLIPVAPRVRLRVAARLALVRPRSRMYCYPRCIPAIPIGRADWLSALKRSTTSSSALSTVCRISLSESPER